VFSMGMMDKSSCCGFLQVIKLDIGSGTAPGNMGAGLDSTPE
jgi:hypothetical protein